MGLISWIKGLFATPEVIDPPASSNTGYEYSSVTITASVPATKPKKTKKAPKAPKETKKPKVKEEPKPAEKPKKARKPRAKKAKEEATPLVFEEVTIEEIGENYADAAKIESDDEIKLQKKDE